MNPYIKISGYTSHKNKKDIMVPGCVPYDTDFYTEMLRIKEGYYKILIEHMRSIEDPDQRKYFKSGFLPSLTISAVCKNWRSIENIVHHTGLLNIDIDSKGNEHISDWGAVRDDIFFKLPDVVCSFLSASGNGVTFVVKIDHNLHLDSFLSISDSMQDYFNLKIDLVAKDPSRLRFVSYDPDLRIRFNFNELGVSKPTLDYWKKRAKESARTLQALPATEADSLNNFREGMKRAEANLYDFAEGTKHSYLVRVAGYCNATGMTQAFCEKMVFKHFRSVTTITDAELLQPVKNAYKTYRAQFSSARLRFPKLVPIRHKRFLLSYVDKAVLRKYNYIFYGRTRIIGKTDYVIKVDSPLLVYLMWLIGPEYTWTCENERFNKYFSAEDCKANIPEDSYLQHVNGGEVWVSKTLQYPINW